MNLHKKTPALLLIAALLAVFGFSGPSYAGGVVRNVRNVKGPVDAQLGVRFVSQLPDNPKEGDTMDAIVLNPAKLAAHGFAGLKRGDRITFIQGRQAELFHVRQGTRLQSFKINAKGAVIGL